MNPSTLQATWATQDPSTAGDASRRVHFQNPLQQARRATQEDGDTLQGALAGDTGRRRATQDDGNLAAARLHRLEEKFSGFGHHNQWACG
jgi:hypothetical protein